jgi:hypothetical protein
MVIESARRALHQIRFGLLVDQSKRFREQPKTSHNKDSSFGNRMKKRQKEKEKNAETEKEGKTQHKNAYQEEYL